jgi:hypothetical protein
MSATAKPILIGIDLMPKPMKLSLLRRNRMRLWGTILTTTAAVAALPVGMELLNQHRLNKAIAANQQRALSIENARQTLRTVQTDAESRADQLAFADALRAKRNWSGLLSLIAQAAKDDVWLTSMQSENSPARSASGRQPAPGSSPSDANATASVITLEGPRSLILDGYAVDHARLYELMADLRDYGQFVDVDLSKAGMEIIGNMTAVRFRLECQW